MGLPWHNKNDNLWDSNAVDVYIFMGGTMAFPVDKRTPLEAVGDGCALSLLTYKRVNVMFVEPAYGLFNTPRIAC